MCWRYQVCDKTQPFRMTARSILRGPRAQVFSPAPTIYNSLALIYRRHDLGSKGEDRLCDRTAFLKKSAGEDGRDGSTQLIILTAQLNCCCAKGCRAADIFPRSVSGAVFQELPGLVEMRFCPHGDLQKIYQSGQSVIFNISRCSTGSPA